MPKIVAVIFLASLCHVSANILEFNFLNNFKNKSFAQIGVSEICQKQYNALWDSYHREELWALKMIDATGKLPSGLLNGNIVSVGTFGQCLSINEKLSTPDFQGNIKGKFCAGPLFDLTDIPIPADEFSGNTISDLMKSDILKKPKTNLDKPQIGGFNYLWSVCFPADCSNVDLALLASSYPIVFIPYPVYCQEETRLPLDTADIVAISFFGVIAAIMIASTIYDVVLHEKEKEPLHSSLIAFSMYTNGKKIFTTTKNPKQITCLNGLRVLSLAWIILAHRYNMYINNFSANVADTVEWISKLSSMYIIGNTVSVDTFFVIGGVVLSYTFMTSRDKGIKFNIPLFYIHRYIRLTPAVAATVLVYVTFLENIGSGPLWPDIFYLFDNCRKRWWRVLLYIQNFFYESQCIPQTWYLSVDMQLYILSPILLLPLVKYPKTTLGVTALLNTASMVASGVIAWHFQLNAIHGGSRSQNYFNYYYNPTYTRASPWLIGFIAGYYIYKIKTAKLRLKIPQWVNLLFWAVSFAVLLTCIYIGHEMLPPTYDRLAHTFYIALVRPAWALGIAWIIIACAGGYGGPINWLLSLSFFEVTSKLSFSMYLVHLALVNLQAKRTNVMLWFSDYDTIYNFCGDFAISFFVALFWALAFEYPMVVIEKVLFDPKTGIVGKLFNRLSFKVGKTRKEITTKKEEKVSFESENENKNNETQEASEKRGTQN